MSGRERADAVRGVWLRQAVGLGLGLGLRVDLSDFVISFLSVFMAPRTYQARTKSGGGAGCQRARRLSFYVFPERSVSGALRFR